MPTYDSMKNQLPVKKNKPQLTEEEFKLKLWHGFSNACKEHGLLKRIKDTVKLFVSDTKKATRDTAGLWNHLAKDQKKVHCCLDENYSDLIID